MSKFSKILIGLIVTVVALLISGILFSGLIINSSLPEYEGEVSVIGNQNNIKIIRDERGIPYVEAKSDLDIAFGIGYVHAQERMFQMDMFRRAGEGRISEIVGSQTVMIDRLFKTLELHETVLKNYEKMDPVSKGLLISYSNGVNSFLESNRNNCGIEFDVLGYAPENWEPAHSLLVAKIMAAMLNINWWTDIVYADLLQELDENLVKELIAGYPENAPTIIPGRYKKRAEIDKGFIKADRLFREWFGFQGNHIGSNNWVVSPDMSSSGKAMVANDIHLAFQLPGTWFALSINSKDWNAAGFSLPGTPGIVMGANKKISWAVTNVMTDDSDFYFEKLDSSRTKYLYKGKWHDLEIVSGKVSVRDSLDYEFKILKTHRGPIISSLHPYNQLFNRKNSEDISIRWTGTEFSDELLGIYKVNKASNWNEFKEALSHYKMPGQNFMYADSSGNIGYVCAALIPVRRNNSPTMVFDGTTDNYEWQGFLSYDRMPKLFNPSQNYIASANNKIDKNFKYHISNIWEPPSRITRIEELLNSKEKHSIEDFRKYQMDVFSYHAKEISSYIEKAFKGINITDKNMKIALRLIHDWDYRMDKESQTPSIFLYFYQQLLENIYLDEMGESNFKEFKFIANMPYKTTSKLLKEKYNIWFDDIETEIVEDRDLIIRKSLADALTQLEAGLGDNIEMWQWKELHKFKLTHPFSRVFSALSGLLDIGPYSVSGDGTTLNNTEYSFNEPFNVRVGATLRYTYDFAEPNVLNITMPAGQSGHFASSNYSDFTDDWLAGNLYKMYLSADSLKDKKVLVLRANTNE